MKPQSYRFVVARKTGSYVFGVLPGVPGGNQAALSHLERTYSDWTKIIIQKTNTPAIMKEFSSSMKPLTDLALAQLDDVS